MKANGRLQIRFCLHIVFSPDQFFREVRLSALHFFFNAVMRAALISACFALTPAQPFEDEQRRLFRPSTPRRKNPGSWQFAIAATALLRRSGDEGRDEGERQFVDVGAEARRRAPSRWRRGESTPEREMLPHRAGSGGG